MKIIKTKFKNLFLVKQNVYFDKRGYLFENMNKNFFFKPKLEILSFSKKNVVRGLHFQKINPQHKYLTVVSGEILDVCLDLRKKSKTYGKVFKIKLSSKSKRSIFIPKGFAHGFCSLKKDTIVYYLTSTKRYKNDEYIIKWNDQTLNIDWPKRKMILSEKDKKGMTFEEFKKKIKYI
jgi:dTDP-4-dehydrorhamnose 3,5-epimerase